MTGQRFWVALALGWGILMGAAGGAEAQSQWVAYAYDSTTGAWGMGWGQPNRNAAMNQALSNCVRPGCVVQGSSIARCIAFAHSQNPSASAFGSGPTDADARNNAALFCAQRVHGARCNIVAARCGQ